MAQPQIQVHSSATHYETGSYQPSPQQQHLRKEIYKGVNYPNRHHFNDDRVDDFSSFNFFERGPSVSQILATLGGIFVGGTLLLLASVSFFFSLVGLAIVTPLFILFSPIIVPAVLTIGLAVAAVLTADACGLTGLISLSWVARYIKVVQETVPEQVYSVKGRLADVADYVGQKTKDVGEKTKEVGQDIQNKAHETKRSA
ncbi:oleosin Ara h 10.0101-like [Vicia villosa]|uniref:oleosin Ara h 10.0101-like n=1 Tax=Vicia villosa TaxID=3911 RepID=UPI00273B3F0A|nr:oleosin Ara h 10.0101-like [Vicia villosa]